MAKKTEKEIVADQLAELLWSEQEGAVHKSCGHKMKSCGHPECEDDVNRCLVLAAAVALLRLP